MQEETKDTASASEEQSSFHNERMERVEGENGSFIDRHTFSVDLKLECPKLEQTYKSCFDDWYTNTFLKGKGLENGCKDEWEDFRACMMILVNDKALDITIEKGEKESEWKIKNLE